MRVFCLSLQADIDSPRGHFGKQTNMKDSLVMSLAVCLPAYVRPNMTILAKMSIKICLYHDGDGKRKRKCSRHVWVNRKLTAMEK